MRLKVINECNEGQRAQPRALRETSCQYTPFGEDVANFNSLFPTFEEGKEPFNKYAWNTISQEFIKEKSVVNSIKGLGKVDKESPNRLASIKCTTPIVNDCNESMAGGFALESTKLVIV